MNSVNIESQINSLTLPDKIKRRIIMTAGCRDCDSIPKVCDAGKIFSNGKIDYQLMHNGVKIVKDCYYGEWMTEIIRFLRGHHEPQEEKVIHELLQHIPSHSTMVELGSFWGYYSLWFQKAINYARNYLIEPDPNNLAVGKNNFKLNGMHADFFQAAISDSSKQSVSFKCESDSIIRQIPFISLDDFVALKKIQSIDLLLCDIQGYELNMLRGAIKSIEQGILKFVVISTHHHSISNDPLTHQNCVKFLVEHGAHIIAKHNVTESYSGDGLVAASFSKEDKNLPQIELSYNHPTNSLFRELEYDLASALHKLALIRTDTNTSSQN